MTRDQLASVLGVNPRYVNQLVKEGMPRAGRHGQYELRNCVQWYIASWKERADAALSARDSDESRRISIARARKLEMEVALAEGEHRPVAVLHRVAEQIAGALLSLCEAMPASLAPVLVDMTDEREIRARLDDECRRLRSDCAAALRRLGTD